MSHTAYTEGDIETFLEEREKQELVRVFTCGSVDDGKSTLIGRLLYDAKLLPTDVLASVERDSARYGTTGTFDPALLLDGLQAEREQGITIDVAYRYFATSKRAFIIADTPGHEQYTRNMATGASNADLAIILVDARHGILPQTKRHAFIASLLRVKHVIVAVNKMDLVGYDESVYNQVKEDFTAFVARLEIDDLRIIPLSALKGDNVVEPSTNMSWYRGAALLYSLETIHVASDRNMIDFRFPVQYVHRPDANYRGYAGTVASGVVRKGDKVLVLPSKKHVKIQSIDTFDEPVDEAYATMSVMIRLEGEHDVSRGNMLVNPNNIPRQESAFEAMLVWMNEEPLTANKEYVLKHTTHEGVCTVSTIRYAMDVNTLRRMEVKKLELNDIGRCTISLKNPIPFDGYQRNRETGSFILIDRMTNATVGAGMILDRRVEEAKEEKKTELPVVWLTGNTGAGKSTLAFGVRDDLHENSSPLSGKVIVLDGDEMRETISTDETLSAEDRRKHNLRVARLANLLSKQGFLVIVSVIAPFQKVRDELQPLCDPIWVYIKRSGLEASDKPYEPPKNPSLTIDNDVVSKEEGKKQFKDFLEGLMA